MCYIIDGLRPIERKLVIFRIYHFFAPPREKKLLRRPRLIEAGSLGVIWKNDAGTAGVPYEYDNPTPPPAFPCVCIDGNVEYVGLLGDMPQSPGTTKPGECGGRLEHGVGGDGELAVLIEWKPDELMRSASAGFSDEDVLAPRPRSST